MSATACIRWSACRGLSTGQRVMRQQSRHLGRRHCPGTTTASCAGGRHTIPAGQPRTDSVWPSAQRGWDPVQSQSGRPFDRTDRRHGQGHDRAGEPSTRRCAVDRTSRLRACPGQGVSGPSAPNRSVDRSPRPMPSIRGVPTRLRTAGSGWNDEDRTMPAAISEWVTGKRPMRGAPYASPCP